MLNELSKIEALKEFLEKKYKAPVYIISSSKRFPWNIVLSTIPEDEIYKDPNNVFKLILKNGRVKKFMNTLNKVFSPDIILFYSSKFPLGNKSSTIQIENVKILCVNHPAAQKLLPILSNEPFLEYIIRQYPDVELEKLGLNKEEVDILKKEQPIPQKNMFKRIYDNIFPSRSKDIFEFDLEKATKEKTEDFLKNFNKLVNSDKEISRKEKVLAKLRKLLKEEAIEEEFQDVLIENPWIFGDEYYNCKINRTKFGERSIPDLRIKDIFNNQSLVIELKRGVKVSKKDSRQKGEIAPNANIMQALWQGIRYLEETIKKDVYSEVFIIIGKGESLDREMLNRINFHIPNIRFVTYGELIQRASKRIKSYKPWGLNKVLKTLKDYFK